MDEIRRALTGQATEGPPLRIAPAVRSQLDASQVAHELWGMPVQVIPGLDDKIRLMSKRVYEAEVRAWAMGMELGPLEFEHEQTDNGWTIRATAKFRRREDSPS